MFAALLARGLAYSSLAGLALANASLAQGGSSSVDGPLPVSIVPTVSLVAVIGAAVTVGMMFQRQKDMDRRIRDLEREREPWAGHERRRSA